MRGQHYIQRQNDSLLLYAKISYCPSLDFLNPHAALTSQSKRKESTTSSDYVAEKKVSVYAFYDPELDFTFLSSDEENFKTTGEKSEEIQMDMDAS